MSAEKENIADVAEDVAEDVGHAYGVWFKRYMNIFCRRFLEWMMVFTFGYYNISFGWLMAPLFFLVLREKRAKEKKVKFDIIRSIANADEKDILQEIQRFSNLPSWVSSSNNVFCNANFRFSERMHFHVCLRCVLLNP